MNGEDNNLSNFRTPYLSEDSILFDERESPECEENPENINKMQNDER